MVISSFLINNFNTVLKTQDFLLECEQNFKQKNSWMIYDIYEIHNSVARTAVI